MFDYFSFILSLQYEYEHAQYILIFELHFSFSEYSLSRLEMGNVYISLSRNNARETTQLCEVQVKESMKKECNCSLTQVFLLFPIFQQPLSRYSLLENGVHHKL